MNVRSGAKYDQMSALHQNGQPTDENDGGNRLRGNGAVLSAEQVL